MTSHRVSLPGAGGFTLWRWAQLRGAGFPASWVLRLAAPDAAAACDRLLALEGTEEAIRRRALARCDALLATAVDDERRDVIRVVRNLRSGRVPGRPPGDPALAGEIEALVASGAQREALRMGVTTALASDARKSGAFLRTVAADPLFREAVTWQNRAAIHGGIDALLRREEGRTDQRTREHERLVAKYLQRYCAKNERIGFFGPLGWAALGTDDAPLDVSAGAGLVARRQVFFEFWTIDALAETLSMDPELRPWIAPRRVPTLWLEGDVLVEPIGRSTVLGRDEARLLASCDGARPARDIARELVADPSVGYADEAEAFSALEALVTQGRVVWTLEVPAYKPSPERALRRMLEGVADGKARQRGLAALQELEAARTRVSAAAGDPGALDLALGELDRTFTRLTARAATRHHGESYAGRTLLFEDCVRDVTLRLGAPFLDRLGPPLSLLLASARWYTWTVAAGYRAAFLEVHRALARELGTTAVDYQVFRESAWKLLPQMRQRSKEAPPVVAAAANGLWARWVELLGLTPEARSVERSTRSLEAGVLDRFAAPGPGWPLARFASPDVLLACSLEEARRGQLRFVLGELHVALNTLVAAAMTMEDEPSPAEMLRAWEEDLPPGAFPVRPKSFLAMRISHVSFSPRDFDIELGDARSWRDPSRVVPIGSLVVVEREGGDLEVRQRGSDVAFDLISFLQFPLALQINAHFGVVPPWKHTPRITIDDLVIARETWRFSAEECPFASVRDPVDRFLEVRRWARQHGLPRFVFVKVPEEIKPWYVDLDSPLYVDVLASSVRRASRVVVSEMVPTVEQAWLPGPGGERYSAELRFAAVDPLQWRPGEKSR